MKKICNTRTWMRMEMMIEDSNDRNDRDEETAMNHDQVLETPNSQNLEQQALELYALNTRKRRDSKSESSTFSHHL